MPGRRARPCGRSRMFGSGLAATSHTLIVPSRLAETRLRPSGANATAVMGAVCPRSRAVTSFVVASQIRTVPSPPPVAKVLPSGEKATEVRCVLCPRRVFTGCPWAVSQSRTVVSSLAEARVLPSGENDRDRTQSVCPRRVAIVRRAATSHSRTVLSIPPEARVLPSGENATHSTPPVCPASVSTCCRVADIPDPDGLIQTAGGQELAVRRKGQIASMSIGCGRVARSRLAATSHRWTACTCRSRSGDEARVCAVRARTPARTSD